MTDYSAVSQSTHDIERALQDWQRRLAHWQHVANAQPPSDYRALYLCAATCAERIVRELRVELERSTPVRAGGRPA